MIIAKQISALEANGRTFTDVQIVPGAKLFYRAPYGYEALDEVILTNHDIVAFAQLVEPAWEARLKNGDGHFDIAITLHETARLRCNFFYFGGKAKKDDSQPQIGCQIRRLPAIIPSLNDIGAPAVLEKILGSNAKGLVLITGPTGSGKSTTQAAMLEYLNQNKAVNIVTIEQPIEYEFIRKKALFIQREVPTNVTSFAAGVISAKRQDPDVIMIGEMRDRDTAEACLQAAYSGHLVIATLHSRSALETCEAMLNYFTGEEIASKRHLLASSLLCIVSQVLLPNTSGEHLILATEVLENSQTTATAIRENKLAAQNGAPGANADSPKVQPLNDKLVQLVLDQTVRPADARGVTYDKFDLDQRFKKAGLHG